MSVHAKATHPPLMQTAQPDFRIPPPRLAPGVLALVVLVHLGVLAAILALPTTTPSFTPLEPLFVRLIEPAAVQPEVVAPPVQPRRPPPPAPSIPTPPVLAAPPAPAPPKAEAVKAEPPPRRAEPVRQETPQPEPQPAPVSAPVPAVPVPAPAPVVSEAPKPAPAPLPVTQPRFNADYLDNPKPAYPSISRRMGEEGEVRLRVHVDTAGNARQVEISHSSGFPRLDQAALDTVRQWRFIPARQGDQAISAWVIVPILFSLRS